MASTLELIIQARNSTDAGFKALIANLQQAEAETKKGSAAFAQMEGAAQSMAGRLGSIGSTIAGLGPFGLAAAAGIGAASAALLSLTSHADALDALRDRTGLSTKALQEFELAAKLGNSSLEAVAGGVNKMQRALIDGSTAFGKLGLSIKELKAMAPEDQFRAVATAIEGLSSPAERTAASMAIFGKSGAELAGTLKAVATGAAELDGQLSDETVNAAAAVQDEIDRMSTAWVRLIEQLGGVIAKNPELLRSLQSITTALADLAAWVDRNSERIGKLIEWILKLNGAVTGLPMLGHLLGIGEESNADFATRIQQMKDLADAARKLRLEGGGHFPGAGDDAAARAAEAAARRAQAAWQKAFEESRKASDKFNADMEKAGRSALDDLEKDQDRAIKEMAKNYEHAILSELEQDRKAKEQRERDLKDLADAWEQEQQRMRDEHIKALGEMGAAVQALSGLFQALGFDMDSVFGHILQGLQDGFAAMQEIAEGHVITGALHAMTAAYQNASVAGGALTGAMAGFEIGGPIGAGIGAVVGGLLGLAGAADKARRELKQAHQALQQLADQHGGLTQLKLQAEAAGISLQAAFDARNPQAMAAAIKDIQDQLGLADAATNKLHDAMERWGLTINDLGPAMRQQELDKQAGELWQDWQILIAAGVDINTLIEKMGPGFAKYIDTVVAGGSTIPAAMKPVIDQMYEQGKLLHENGEAYTEAEYKALKYGETQSAIFARFADEIEQLIQALNRMAGIKVNIKPTIEPPEGMPGHQGPPTHEPAQSGAGGGVATRWGEPWILHGSQTRPEFIFTTEQLQMLRATGGNDGASMPTQTIVVPLIQDGRETARLVARRGETGHGRQKQPLRRR